MGKLVDSNRNFRLLAVALHGSDLAMNSIELAAWPGFDLVGEAADYDDGLRQVLMTKPDVIVLPWSVAALQLFRALMHLRNEGFSPLVVAVTSEPLVRELPPHDGLVSVGVDQLDGSLVERLRQLLAAPAQVS